MKVTGKQSEVVLYLVTQTLFFTQPVIASDAILKEDVVIHRDRPKLNKVIMRLTI